MATPTYTLIDSTVLSSAASSVTFSSIPADYRDLVLVFEFTNDTATNAQPYLRFNGDTGSNYHFVDALGYGSGTQSQSGTFTYLNLGNGLAANNGETLFSISSIQDYSVTDKHKAVLVRSNKSDSGTLMAAGRWASTTAISSILIYASFGEFSSGVFSLYGIEA